MKKLGAILLGSMLLRLYSLQTVPHFGDMVWFFDSAHQALMTGRLPLLGITASITWLHQGPLWTYLLLAPTALHIDPVILTLVGGVIAVAAAYFAVGTLAAIVLAILPFAIVESLTAYHTSFIPLFFFIAYLLIDRKKAVLSGLFIGFLYQLHLLTFIYWPLWLYLIYTKRLNSAAVFSGFIVGILPFILAGPVQTFGIFIWVTKQLVTGFGGVSSGVSHAYLVVLLPGFIWGIGKMTQLLSKIKEMRQSSKELKNI